jgi:type I restriction enzyme S subunit
MSGEKALVPELRFPEFDGAWEQKRLGDLGETITGLTYSPSDIRDAGVLVLRSSNVRDRRIFLDDTVYVDPSCAHSEFIQKNDILICVRNGSSSLIGKNAILETELPQTTHGAFMLVFRANEPRFVFHLLDTDCYFRQVAADLGARINSINSGNLRRYLFHIPPLPEQQKIAAFLDAISKKITLLTQKREALTDYKRGLMQRLFSGALRFTRPDGSAFPDWETVPFGKVFTRIRRKNEEYCENVLTISAQAGLVSQLDYFGKSVAGKDLSGYYLLKRGDFAYNKSYSKGYPMGALKRLKEYEKGVVSTLYICFAAGSETEARFYEQYFESGEMNHALSRITQEGARNHGLLNIAVGDFFGQLRIPRPYPEEQAKIANALSALDAKIDAVSSQISQMEAFKKGLLQKMFV